MKGLRPAKNYVLVRCNKQEQKDRQEKIGMFYTHPDHQFMVYNMEWGEVVGVGEKAKQNFPAIEVGHTLIFHHFVQNENKEKSKVNHLVHEDDTYYYYVVTTASYNGKRNETYGIHNGETIIPHPDFVFLEWEIPKDTYATPQEFHDAAMQRTEGGLLVFKQWVETRDELSLKMQSIKNEIQNISRSGLDKAGVREFIFRKEEELEMMSRQLNKIRFLPYKVIYAPKILSEWFDRPIEKGSLLYIQETAAEKMVNFKGTEYRIAPTKYIGYIMG